MKRRSGAAPALALGMAIGLALGGCVVHRGPSWRPAPAHAAPRDGTTYSLVAIGNPGVPGARAARVADRLDRVLADERAAGRRPIVLWLGDLVLPERPGPRAACPELATAWTRKGSRALHAVVGEHVRGGGDAFAVLGPTDRRCGHDLALRQTSATAGPHPWAMPDDHYVVRVFDGGDASVVSSCDATTCRVAAPERGALLDLVIVDATAWIEPPPRGTPARARADESVARLSALVRAATAEDGPPRVLVGSVPVEAAGMHGHGGRHPDATFHNLPDALRSAIAAGRFAGSIGAYDRAVYAAPDLTDAIKRSDRVWVRAPLFQIVSGSASWPDARPGAVARRVPYYRGNAYRPPIYSDHLGFAVLRPSGPRAQAELWAFRRGRWETERLGVSLRPAPNPIESASPSMAPCLLCPQIEASQRQ